MTSGDMTPSAEERVATYFSGPFESTEASADMLAQMLEDAYLDGRKAQLEKDCARIRTMDNSVQANRDTLIAYLRERFAAEHGDTP